MGTVFWQITGFGGMLLKPWMMVIATIIFVHVFCSAPQVPCFEVDVLMYNFDS